MGWWWWTAINLIISVISLAEGYRISHVFGFRLWWIKDDEAD